MFLRLFTVLLFLCALLIQNSAIAQGDLDLPEIGEPADVSLSPRQEKALGKQVYAQLLSRGFILEDQEISEYIQLLGEELATHSGVSPGHFTFFVIQDPRINAFALPGGYIGVHAGLILATEDEAELAGVMAHEIAHVTQRHIARQIDGAGKWDLATLALVLAAVLAGGGGAELIQAAVPIGLSIGMQQRVNHTRAHELEADRVGIRILSQAEFDPHGMVEFFRKQEKNSSLYGEQLPEILRTHPINTTRITEALARAGAVGEIALRPKKLDYDLMHARTRALTSERASVAQRFFMESLRPNPNQLPNRYGLAVAQTELGLFGDASKNLQQLKQSYPRETHLQLALARAQFDAGQAAVGLEQFRTASLNNPEFTPAKLAYAQALLNAGEPRQARQLLLESELEVQSRAEAHRLLSQAARALNDRADAHFHMATYEYRRGNTVQAIRRLNAGLRIPDLDEKAQMRLSSRLKEYRGELPDNVLRQLDRDEREREKERQQGRS